jgi:hypothetical protein
MHIQTQAFIDKLHDLKTRLQLHQNRVGYDFSTQTYIQLALECEDWIEYSGAKRTGMAISEESSNNISSHISAIERYISELQ